MFKHLPLCAFFDYWCGAARELERQAQAVGVDFGPRAGGLVPEVDVVAKQSLSNCPSRFPHSDHIAPSFSLSDHEGKDEHKESLSVADIAIKSTPHPVAPDCPVCFLPHDRLHEVAHKHCTCRDPRHVKQLRAENTERAEHLNATRKRVDRFLRNQSAQRNIFLHLVVAHLQNYKINKAKFEDMKAQVAVKQKQQPQFKWTLAVNEFGQIFEKKERR